MFVDADLTQYRRLVGVIQIEVDFGRRKTEASTLQAEAGKPHGKHYWRETVYDWRDFFLFLGVGWRRSQKEALELLGAREQAVPLDDRR